MSLKKSNSFSKSFEKNSIFKDCLKKACFQTEFEKNKRVFKLSLKIPQKRSVWSKFRRAAGHYLSSVRAQVGPDVGPGGPKWAQPGGNLWAQVGPNVDPKGPAWAILVTCRPCMPRPPWITGPVGSRQAGATGHQKGTPGPIWARVGPNVDPNGRAQALLVASRPCLPRSPRIKDPRESRQAGATGHQKGPVGPRWAQRWTQMGPQSALPTICRLTADCAPTDRRPTASRPVGGILWDPIALQRAF